MVSAGKREGPEPSKGEEGARQVADCWERDQGACINEARARANRARMSGTGVGPKPAAVPLAEQ